MRITENITIRSSYMSIVVSISKHIWQIALGGFIALSSFSETVDTSSILLGALLFAGIIALYLFQKIANWYFDTYTFTATELIIKKGIIAQKTARIPYKNIHSFNCITNPVQKIFHLVDLDIDSAAKVEFQGTKIIDISPELVEEITKFMIARRDVQMQASDKPSDKAFPQENAGEVHRIGREAQAKTPRDPRSIYSEHTEYVLGFKELCLAVLIHCNLFITFLFFVGIAQMGDNILQVLHVDISQFTPLLEELGIIQAVLVGMGAFVLTLFVVSFVRALLRFAEFTLEANPEEIVVRRGILTTTSKTIVRNRVQALEIRNNIFSKLCGYTALYLVVAGDSASSDGQRDTVPGRVLLTPCIAKDRVDSFLSEFLPEYARAKQKVSPHYLSKSIYTYMICSAILKSCAISIGLLFAGLLTSSFLSDYLYISLLWWFVGISSAVVFALFIGMQIVGFPRDYCSISKDFLVVNDDGLTESCLIVPKHCIQAFTVKQGILRRAFNTYKIVVHVLNKIISYKQIDAIDACFIEAWIEEASKTNSI